MTCLKCHGSHLLPFVKKGKAISGVFVHCDCYEPHDAPFTDIKPDAIDFPCSYSWRQYYEQALAGKELPGLEPKPRRERIVREVTRFVVPVPGRRIRGQY